MSFGGDSHLFSGAAKLYANPSVRPLYPPGLFDQIYRFCGPSRDAALDVATGSGQCSRELAKDFRKVVGIDANEEQVKHCKPGPNLEYQVACAEQTNQSDSSIDLVTVATALHWFDHPAFYKEVRRILKPDGAFAAWCYTIPRIKGNEKATQLIESLFKETLAAYISPAHKHYFAEYRDIQPTEADFRVVKRAELEFEQPSSVRSLVNFANTTSVLGNMRKQAPEKEDPLIKFQEDLLQAIGSSDVDSPLTSVWHTFIILAKNPVPLS